MNPHSLKPIKRSPFRIYCGVKYYRLKRYTEWFLGKEKFALQKEDLLEYPIFQHQTLLLRELKDGEIWLQHNKVKNLNVAT